VGAKGTRGRPRLPSTQGETRENQFKKDFVGGVWAVVTGFPMRVMADGFNFNVKIGDDNGAHYHFRDHQVRHDPQMLRAARSLANAKNHLG
jgi:hypothetical protein